MFFPFTPPFLFIFLRLGYRYIHWSPGSLNHWNYVGKAVERHSEYKMQFSWGKSRRKML